MLFFITASPTSGSRISYSNTSHVILYLHLLLHLQRLELHSNTSHVILYQKYFRTEHILRRIQIHLMLFFICIFYCIYSVLSCIQIHLMLFFILVDEEVQKLLTRFKYISCYSLSRQKEWKPRERGHSNTSHVILYQSCVWLSITVLPIQIHLMLFFITECSATRRTFSVIQIHLMLFFIKEMIT